MFLISTLINEKYSSIFIENLMKNIKKPPTADALYLDEGVKYE
jgi:hypothetical protein